MTTRYPVYIPSKGRVKLCYTADCFVKDGVDFYIVVEPQEADAYKERYGDRVLVLPENNQGLIYSRKWIRQHSIDNGFKRHWQFDDNIRDFYRYNHGKRIYCNAQIALDVAEEFTDRYKNIALSGFNYDTFVYDSKKPYRVNCHVYSAFLLNNESGFIWRLQWNDDVDLCLQIVTTGYWCIVQFNAFVVGKIATMTVKGGCSTEYMREDFDVRRHAAKVLAMHWPEHVKVVRKFKRWHFHINKNWQQFKHKLIRRDDIDWDAIKAKTFDIKLNAVRGEIRSEKLKRIYAKENGQDK